LVTGEQEVNILAEILDNSADVFEDLAKEIGSEDIVGKLTGCRSRSFSTVIPLMVPKVMLVVLGGDGGRNVKIVIPLPEFL
jgi:hypothetical protein